MKISEIQGNGIVFDNGYTLYTEYSEEDLKDGSADNVMLYWTVLKKNTNIYSEEFSEDIKDIIIEGEYVGINVLLLQSLEGRVFSIPCYCKDLFKTTCAVGLSFNGISVDLFEKFYIDDIWPVEMPHVIKKVYANGILFQDGTKLQTYHQQDCCESHWADWKMLNSYNINPKTGCEVTIFDLEFPKSLDKLIQKVENEGFCICAVDGSKYFIPCYGENNGYYDVNLTLIMGKQDGYKELLDLTSCQLIAGGIDSMRWKRHNAYMEYPYPDDFEWIE